MSARASRSRAPLGRGVPGRRGRRERRARLRGASRRGAGRDAARRRSSAVLVRLASTSHVPAVADGAAYDARASRSGRRDREDGRNRARSRPDASVLTQRASGESTTPPQESDGAQGAIAIATATRSVRTASRRARATISPQIVTASYEQDEALPASGEVVTRAPSRRHHEADARTPAKRGRRAPWSSATIAASNATQRRRQPASTTRSTARGVARRRTPV